jgi:hypothetical protein
MKTLISIGTIAISSIALNLIPVQPSQAVTFVNGDFSPNITTSTSFRWGSDNPNALEPSAANTNAINGWTSEGYNFLVRSGTGVSSLFYGSNLVAPNGVDYYIAADSAYQTGRISQNLTDLVIGQTYNISFYQAASQQKGFNGDTYDNWIVNVGGEYIPPALNGGYDNTNSNLTSSFVGGTTYVSPTMNLASQTAAGSQTVDSGNGTIVSGNGVAGTAGNIVSTGTSSVAGGAGVTAKGPTAVGWQQDSFAFTATGTEAKLSFLSQGTPTGKPPFALLSGVSIKQIPEPDTYVGTLFGLGCLGLVVKSQLAKKKLDK